MEIQNGEINYSFKGYPGDKIFYLNHSCAEWVIGNIEEAKKFAEDLLLTIKQVEEANMCTNCKNIILVEGECIYCGRNK